MNPINRALAALVLSILFVSGAGAETVIDQLYGLRNYELAEAYWIAGQRFADLGQKDRAAEFQAQAKRIFKGFVPGQAPAFQALPVAAPEAPKVPDVAAVREENLQGEKIARLQFQKLLRGYLTGSASTLASAVADKVDVQGQTLALDTAGLKALLEAHPSEAGTPDDLFQTNTLEVSNQGQRVTITISANPEADLSWVPFWKPLQTYTFDRVGDTWKLVKVEGQ